MKIKKVHKKITVKCSTALKQKRTRQAKRQLDKEILAGAKEVLDSLKKARAKNYKLLNLYGITLNDYFAKSALQRHVCAICKQSPKTKSLCVDHIHRKDKKKKMIRGCKEDVRGLVCYFCNKYIIGAIERRNIVNPRDVLNGLNEYFKMYKMKGE